jgi:hypothetical protein
MNKTALWLRRSPHSISTLRLTNIIRTQEKGDLAVPLGNFVLAQRLWRRLTPCRLLDSMQPGGLISPLGLEAAAGLIRRAALDAMSGQ